MYYWLVGLSFALALTLGLYFVPLVRKLARRAGFVDRPDKQRKIQKQPVSLGGGLAIFFSTLVTVVAMLLVAGPAFRQSYLASWFAPGLLLACVIITLVGLYDDAFELKGAYKLLFQVIAATAVIGNYLIARRIPWFDGGEIAIGYFGFLLSLFWMLAAINSLNLIDGVDGLAGTVGLIFATTLAIICTMRGLWFDAILAFALAGALVAFLRFNLAPASIYLGDTGSMLIGLLLGALCLRTSLLETASLALSAPFAIWAIPIFDSLAAVIRRKLTGRSIYATDRGHIHHMLLTRGLSPTQTVAAIGALCVVTCGTAVLGLYLQRAWISYLSGLAVVAGLIFTRVFGHVEFLLLNSHLVNLGRGISSEVGLAPARPASRTYKLQGSLPWEKTWHGLVETAERFGLTSIRLSVLIPRLHEGFFAEWKLARGRRPHRAHETEWTLSLPIVCQSAVVGRLQLKGDRDCQASFDQLASLAEFVDLLEAEASRMIRDCELAAEPAGAAAEPASAPATREPAVAGPPGVVARPYLADSPNGNQPSKSKLHRLPGSLT